MNIRTKIALVVAVLWVVCCFQSISSAQSPAGQADLPITAATRTQVIESVLSRLNESYVLPEIAARMEQSIRSRMQKGEYDKINSSAILAQTLTAHLGEIAKDKHLGVGFSYDPIPKSSEQKEPSAEDRERFRRMASATNFGFEKVERLNGNIGYMELDGFVTTELGAETAIAAMQFLANTDALIIDLRYNGGGVPGTAQLIISYLFGETPVHYHSIYWRHNNRTEQFWTLPYVPGKRYVGKPVYVLMGRRTLSAPESFAYSLQAQKRVTVVGEVSAGGANPGRVFRINEHFQIFVPTGRAVNPVTGTNWEGTGVKPDIETTFADALKTAHLTALRTLLETSTSERKKEQLKSVIEEVEKQP
ncbi:MAG TPA: S41 family peptidase [Pyrinomonadaceae bacterium]|nr:S41 family peptidase [Pyrinomonadaceae bacterium]